MISHCAHRIQSIAFLHASQFIGVRLGSLRASLPSTRSVFGITSLARVADREERTERRERSAPRTERGERSRSRPSSSSDRGDRPRSRRPSRGSRPVADKSLEAGIFLAPSREKPILQKNHFIFYGAVEKLGQCADGDIVPVFSSERVLLGHAFVHLSSDASIIGRMVSFGRADPMQAIDENLALAFSMRKYLFPDDSITNAFRLVNGEGDRLPGLVIDRYADHLVLQFSTRGMYRLKDHLMEKLASLSPETSHIYEKRPSRISQDVERVDDSTDGWLKGGEGLSDQVEIVENGNRLLVDIPGGQKTGFYLDQREMRSLVQQLSHNRSVCNLFSYSGGFSVSALRGGAIRVDSVDISQAALQLARLNVSLNKLDESRHNVIAKDVFDFLRDLKPGEYDLIVLDPPAFAKSKADVVSACRGYKDLNRLAIKNAAPGGIVVTSSCSGSVDAQLFQQVVFQAADEAQRTVSIIGRHVLAPDHPINIFHPLTEYLKSLVLYVH
mmetsp:Transcript_25558/g.42048  ORF Transcript_25558/g.42048 Transcript_25558/m.42048 type:complete len:499 (+) Transcript_25558:1004-2500(+)